METHQQGGDPDAVFEIRAPERQTLPVVLASPHSGNVYPPEFLAAARIEHAVLRSSEDCFVDEIFAAAPDLGAPLIRALFPRAFLDPNREAFELDPWMFDAPLPAFVNTRSPRVAAGLGTIARVVATGEEIYAGKLSFAEARQRVERFYLPYHQALERLVERTRQRFGHCILLDCHSMPSPAGTGRAMNGPTCDFVLGDCFGTSCAPAVIGAAERLLGAKGYRVALNAPYAGGHTTQHYGRPGDGVHALQIEIDRTLYMDEPRFERLAFLPVLARHMEELVQALGALDPAALAPS